jgi:HTH-type transcriptional regulator/antitoxin HigA
MLCSGGPVPILNHREYRSAKAQIAQLARAVGQYAVIRDIATQFSADVSSARQETLKAELQRLQAEVAAYEKLRGNDVNSESEIEVDDLGLLPIIGRIARRLSQRQLAERLDIKEQQVQRYESERYAGIGLARYQKTLDALGIELHPRLTSSWQFHEPEAEKNVFRLTLTPALLRELRKRNWIELPNSIDNEEAAGLFISYIEYASKIAKGTPFHRKSSTTNSESIESTLTAWRARVLRVGTEQHSRVKSKFNITDASWLEGLIALSVYPDGPIRAAELLRERGIAFVVEPHLPHTLLDGAALLLSDSTPIVALTLRHDRLDNFWFTLLHEMGHIFLHFNRGLEAGFLDDLDDDSLEKTELEADRFAQSNLLPDEVWSISPARFSKSAEPIKIFAEARNIHPAIVAGRIRRDRNNYRIFDEIVGRGQVRRLFLHQS